MLSNRCMNTDFCIFVFSFWPGAPLPTGQLINTVLISATLDFSISDRYRKTLHLPQNKRQENFSYLLCLMINLKAAAC